jgi:hypothetical protein
MRSLVEGSAVFQHAAARCDGRAINRFPRSQRALSPAAEQLPRRKFVHTALPIGTSSNSFYCNGIALAVFLEKLAIL